MPLVAEVKASTINRASGLHQTSIQVWKRYLKFQNEDRSAPLQTQKNRLPIKEEPRDYKILSSLLLHGPIKPETS
jgi:hypothetical protein